MGNRGCLHDEGGRIVAFSRRDAWVTCLLQFKGQQREIMASRRYTELFFLDEATALAAGHRPCATCRRADYDRFKRQWLDANRERLPGKHVDNVAMSAIDRYLAVERTGSHGKRTWCSRLGELPDGAMVVIDGGAWLKRNDALHMWSFAGYTERSTIRPSLVCEVLTPPSVVEVLRSGYEPDCHVSAS